MISPMRLFSRNDCPPYRFIRDEGRLHGGMVFPVNFRRRAILWQIHVIEQTGWAFDAGVYNQLHAEEGGRRNVTTIFHHVNPESGR